MLSETERRRIEELSTRLIGNLNSEDEIEFGDLGDPRLEEAITVALASIRSSRRVAANRPAAGLDTIGQTMLSSSFDVSLPDYEILREVGRGGMGVVYEAIQLSLQRRVALKLLPTDVVANERAVSRFRLEARAAAKLKHDNIVRVYEVGLQDEVLYYAMEFVEGVDLTSVVKFAVDLFDAPIKDRREEQNQAAAVAKSTIESAFSTLPPQEYSTKRKVEPPSTIKSLENSTRDGTSKPSTLGASSTGGALRFRDYTRRSTRMIVDVARALHYAHENGVIHRDIKPGNLLLDNQGRVWVSDFGLAKIEESDLTRTGDIMGTLRYMSPERFSGECDETADIYALGLTLYELLARRPAFDAVDRVSLIDRIVREDPTELRKIDSRIPFDLETIIAKAIAKEPNRRYATAAAFADDLQRFLDDVPILARKVRPHEKAILWARKNPVVSLLTSSILVGLTVVAIGSTLAAAKYRSIAQAEQDANQKAAEEFENAQREERISSAINQFFNDDILGQADVQRNVQDLTVREALLAAASRLEGRFTDMPVVEGELRRTIGRSLAGIGQFEKGIEHLLKSQELLNSTLGPDNLKTVQTVGQLARAYRDWERYDQAQPFAERYLSAVQKSYGENSAETFQAKHMLAMNLDGLDQHADASQIMQEVVDWRRKNLGTEHPDTIRSILQLGSIWLYSDKFKLAEPLVIESAELSQRYLGDDNYVTLVANDNLSYLYLESGRYGDAQPVIERSLELTRRYFGESHPSVASTMGKLSTLYAKTGRMEEAIEARKKNVDLTANAFGPLQEVTFNTRFELARLLRLTQQFEEADSQVQSITEDVRKSLGETHQFMVIAEGELGQIDFSQQDYEAAKVHFEKAYKQSLKQFGETSFTMTYASLLGNAGWMLQDYGMAAGYWDKSLQDSIRNGESLTRTLPMRRQVAMAQLKLGDMQAAKKTIADSIPMFDDIPPEAIVMVGEKYRMLLDLTDCHLKLGEYDEAEQVARSVIAFDGWQEGKEYRQYRGKVMLGTSLVHQGRYEEAETELSEGYTKLLATEAKPADLKRALEGLIELYGQTNQADKKGVHQQLLEELLASVEEKK